MLKKLLYKTGIPSVLGPEEFGKKCVSFAYPTINMDTTEVSRFKSNKDFQKYLESVFDVDILKVPQDYLTRRFGPVCGYRKGRTAYVAEGLDPVTERSLMAHEAGPTKDHKALQSYVENLFKNLGDWPALYRTIEIGENLGKREGWRR